MEENKTATAFPTLSDPLVQLLYASLPPEVLPLVDDHFASIDGGDYAALLLSDRATELLRPASTADRDLEGSGCWSDPVSQRADLLLTNAPEHVKVQVFLIGYAALLAFLQSNFTGPPLPFDCARTLFGSSVAQDSSRLSATRSRLLSSLGRDGVAAYKLTPNVELLCLAHAIISRSAVQQDGVAIPWARLRTAFVHQQILSEPAPTLQQQIYQLLEDFEGHFGAKSGKDKVAKVEFLLEKVCIETYYGNDRLARDDIGKAAKERNFSFALTGMLGKRTKYQEKDTSQLVVLAKSHEVDGHTNGTTTTTTTTLKPAPTNLDMNDDTLLESISFTDTDPGTDPARITPSEDLPSDVANIDPSAQPLLEPLDSVILLSLASSITNTSPADGLTREQTLPYATRVLSGGSSNWQIYTQALLVRSRVEGYRSRTVERGLLQLQALVDQVILDTSPPKKENSSSSSEHHSGGVVVPEQSSFLPRPDATEAAPAQERLRYAFVLCPPARWQLEAELAQRWISLGGLRSALDIYERLEMWAEAALCLAATDREGKARSTVRRLLYQPVVGKGQMGDSEGWEDEGVEKTELPGDAPRLFCILGDLDSETRYYERAWDVSRGRYARAQRSLGRHWFGKREHVKAAEAYSKSLQVDRLNHASWFALGCALLELQSWERAAESFTRCVQLDERDAEAWSNLAAAILRQGDEETGEEISRADTDLGQESQTPRGPRRRRGDALRALKKAASIKHDSHRIWENVLVVAASVDPPELSSVIAAQSRIIDLRGKTDGEQCVDVEVLSLTMRSIMSTAPQYDASKPGPERMLVELFDRKIQPLITGDPRLWSLAAKLALWRKKPLSALEAHEKGWRVVTGRPQWEEANEQSWNAVVDATVELCDAYESLGPMRRTEGLGAGELVARDWRFKARSAIRTVLGKGRANWEDTDGWQKLQEAMQSLKA